MVVRGQQPWIQAYLVTISRLKCGHWSVQLASVPDTHTTVCATADDLWRPCVAPLRHSVAMACSCGLVHGAHRQRGRRDAGSGLYLELYTHWTGTMRPQ